MKKKSRNILVVDDSKVIIAMIKMHMQSLTLFNVFYAYSFSEAKKLIDENEFFIAIVDLELPDANSGEALEYALSNNVPSVVLSGTVNEALRQRIFSSTLIIDYIAKDNTDSIFYAVELVKSLDFFYGKKVLVVDDSTTSRAYVAGSFSTLLFITPPTN
jgi:CheY-like chemotaxis protein